MAVLLELRYRGLRSPHKLKLGVSGCARECAEARGKDVGLIATDKGWNIYVGGNGGFTPRHAELLVEDVDDETAIAIIDRYLVYYVRTADRLQRTAPWQQEHEGGLDRIREIVVDDALGIAADLEAYMARHVDDYEDEWAAVLRDPERLRQFSSFVNAPDVADPSLAYVDRTRPAPPRDAGRARRRRHGIRPRAHRPDHPGGSLMTAVADRLTRVDICSLRPAHPRARRRRARGRRAGRRVPAGRRPGLRGVEPVPVLRGRRDLARHHRVARRRADHRVARLQAGLLARRRALPRCRGQGLRCPVVDPTWRCTP